ncbi:MAG: hypothetical protein OSB10_10885, partial [Planctomycetota bacterium]|nr:hypothetical protein [Planctomycetota bacterium]
MPHPFPSGSAFTCLIPDEDGLLGTFSWIDWLVVLAFLAFTTWVGHRKSGEQLSIRDFFLGGRKL